MQDVDLDIEPAGKMLLDALLAIKAQDETLSLRRSCREGVCGSDAVNVNGRNRLACITPLSELKEPIEVRPLPGLPVIRDLIVDMEPFYKQYRSIKPWLVNDDPEPEVERLQSPAGSCTARRRLRVHPVRVLHDRVPVVLVEPGKIRRSGGAVAGIPLHCRQSRRGNGRAARQPGGSVPAVSLPRHHELRGRLPQGAEPDGSDRAHQVAAGETACLTSCPGAAGADCLNSISGWVAFGPRTALHFNLTRQPRWSGS